MRVLPLPPLPGAILSFDFDGTMHHPRCAPPVPRELFEEIERVRMEYNALWGINTGRSMGHMVEGIAEGRFPFLPDWVVARECEIYVPNAFGRWLPHAPWNKRMKKEVASLFKKSAKLLRQIRREVEEHTGAQWLEHDGEPAGVVARTPEEIEWITGRVVDLAADEPRLCWQRNSIYLRFGHRDYQKGSCLAEVSRLHHVPAARCFAIGDSHNDFEMLDPRNAGMCACPANAVPEIMAAVRSAGGLVTTGAHGEGAAEALRHFFPPKNGAAN